MGRYLTTIEIAPGLTARDYRVAVGDAARKVGLKIEFRPHPVPGSPAYAVKPHDPMIGCLLLKQDTTPDLTEFWQLYEYALVRIKTEKGL